MPRGSFHLPLRALKALYAHPLGLRPTELAKSLSVSPRSLAKALEAPILAFLREEALRAHLQRFPPKPLTPRTLSTVAAVQADLGQVRQLGFARARGEAIPDRCGLAVPLRAATGEAFAALGLSLPMGDPCVFEAPEAPKACRACRALAPALKEVVAELWPSSAA